MKSAFYTNESEIKFIDKLKRNLDLCHSFCFSVSFIKRPGLRLLASNIEAAISRGAQGKLITSTYQNFTDIDSLQFFLRLQNEYPDRFACHLDRECFQDLNGNIVGFHSKGYLFEFEDHQELLVGSSNITVYALLKNIEWDVSVIDEGEDQTYSAAMTEFDSLWQKTLLLSQDLIDEYRTRLYYSIERWDMDYDIANSEIKPNYMQRRALKELNRIRAIGAEKALVVASAGSGKTFLAAFDALNFNPKRLLYIVHEGSILTKSYETFQKVFGSDRSYGIYNGEYKESDADFVFSTNVTMANSLELFDVHTWDYIIIDECHHATADTYQKILKYFQPQFLLGITATPERMDREDVFSLFDQNVPYELRLRDAIINGLVVPFKYYGIRDELIEYGITATKGHRFVEQFSDEKHCDFIYKAIEAHRQPGQKLKALAFCRSIHHARMMAENLGEHYHTAFLSGSNKTGERIRAFNDLQSDNKELEILFAVDILNEGVDIPGVNMVLFLRPTESSTIFIQQLGRGLRKYPNKNYVTILDFIGNSYKRSVHIALALGSLSKGYVLEKKLLKAMVRDDFRVLGLDEYGVKINIDDLSKEEILQHIDNENFNQIRYLKKDYQNFKSYLKAPSFPKHMDYVNSDYAPNLLKFMKIKIEGTKTNSYYGFLKGIGEDVPLFTDHQVQAINYISSLLPLVRRHEYLVVKQLIDGATSKPIIRKAIEEEISGYTDEQLNHALRFMEEGGVIIQTEDSIHLRCEVDTEFVDFVSDLLEYGLSQYSVRYKDEDDFLLYHDYRQDQALLKILENPKHNQLGTYYKNGNVYIFAGLKKDDSVQEHLNYKDKFLDHETFQWESIANISLREESLQRESKQAFVFVRKVKTENGLTLPFTFVGTGQLLNPRKGATANGSILYDIHMDNPLPDDLMEDFRWTA